MHRLDIFLRMHSGALTRLATRAPAVLSFLAMRPIRFILCVFAAWAAGSMRGAEGAPQIGAQNESIGNEVQLALDRGFEFAAARQNWRPRMRSWTLSPIRFRMTFARRCAQ